jgi:hypothetical protein
MLIYMLQQWFHVEPLLILDTINLGPALELLLILDTINLGPAFHLESHRKISFPSRVATARPPSRKRLERRLPQPRPHHRHRHRLYPHAGTSSTQPPQPLHRRCCRSTTKEQPTPARKRPNLTPTVPHRHPRTDRRRSPATLTGSSIGDRRTGSSSFWEFELLSCPKISMSMSIYNCNGFR